MLKNLYLRVRVKDDGQLEMPALQGVQPGDYEAVLVLGRLEIPVNTERAPLKLPVLDLVPMSPHDTFRREDIYGDIDLNGNAQP